MHELRWNPVLSEWVVIASARHRRPVLRSECPFCPGSPEVEGQWTVKALLNRFPALNEDAPRVTSDDQFYRKARAYGQCEVLLETKDHSKDLADLDDDNFLELMKLYRERYVELGSREGINYVFIFRNKGEIIGVTLRHPHGQLYALPFIPPVAAKKLEASSKFMERTGRCLCCELARRESSGPRLVTEKGAFIAHVPFAARFAYQTMILPREHRASLAEMDEGELADLGRILKDMLGRYNRLFGFSLPYVMCLYNAPTDGGEYPHHHFHIDIMPRHRSRNQLKYLAGSELGAGMFINDGPPEERAAELRSL